MSDSDEVITAAPENAAKWPSSKFGTLLGTRHTCWPLGGLVQTARLCVLRLSSCSRRCALRQAVRRALCPCSGASPRMAAALEQLLNAVETLSSALDARCSRQVGAGAATSADLAAAAAAAVWQWPKASCRLTRSCAKLRLR